MSAARLRDSQGVMTSSQSDVISTQMAILAAMRRRAGSSAGEDAQPSLPYLRPNSARTTVPDCTACSLVQLLALYGCLTAVHLSSRPDYILVIDCGSTGTRM